MSNTSPTTSFSPRFIVIGLDDKEEQCFPLEVQEKIRKGCIFSGGIRHHALVQSLLPEQAEWIDISVPLNAVFEQYRNKQEIVVFASGDPLFFGFANTLKREFPQAELELFPYFNSLQVLAHRLQMPYHDMKVVSLTGRPWKGFDCALLERTPKIGVLTDRKKTPAVIAQRMLDYGYNHYRMFVGEHLGNKELEQVRSFSLTEVTNQAFTFPNNILLVGEEKKLRIARPFGIADEQFELLNGRKRMITKAPIRLATLSALQLSRYTSFWDIGFCTGSVSIEAKLQFPHLEVTSFEKRPEGKALLQINSQRFGALGLAPIIGDFMTLDITAYPPPEAVFIGGHGGALHAMIEKVSRILSPGGTLVFNAVSPQSKQEFIQAAEDCNLSLQPATKITVDLFNPIEILKATSPIY